MKYKEVYLKDIADIVMGQSPKSEFYNKMNQGYPFLQGVKDFGDKYPQIQMYTTSCKKIAARDDILFSVRAPVGEVNLAKQKIAIGRGLASIKVKENYSRDYVYYCLKAMKRSINIMATGTVFSSINKHELADLKLKIPDKIYDQRKVATYFQKIDQKIELNKQINDNLVA